ncbi:hypothetical protein PybrP1_000429 [[Pythium] brassicae (nom. inval.)]|nr:hypothetical protein PybrP1_000429 [[Pythium] brassicae (nom. inval.)]
MVLTGSRLFKNKRLLLLAFVVLAVRAMPKLRWLLRLAHYKLTAEVPQLVYRKTPQNAQLLERCETLTKLATVNEQHPHPAIPYERQLLDLPDGGVVSLDWALPQWRGGAARSVQRDVDPLRRTVLVLPGLTGGSGEFYIRTTVDRLLALGWQVVVLNSRGCANTPLRTPQLFNCAYTDDLRFVVRHLCATYRFASREAFVGLGYSMGSNVLVKYLGEEKDRAGLTAAISVGNPFDLEACSANFGSFFNRLTYDKVLNGNLRALFFEKSNAHEIFQDFPGIDLDAVKNSRTVREFDHHMTSLTFRYPSVDHYYADSSSLKKLPGVRVPLLCVNARDDPISVALPSRAQVEANPNVILCVTKSGGHLGFFEDSAHPEERPSLVGEEGSDDRGVRMWSAKVVVEFAESVLAKERATKRASVIE